MLDCCHDHARVLFYATAGSALSSRRGLRLLKQLNMQLDLLDTPKRIERIGLRPLFQALRPIDFV